MKSDKEGILMKDFPALTRAVYRTEVSKTCFSYTQRFYVKKMLTGGLLC